MEKEIRSAERVQLTLICKGCPKFDELPKNIQSGMIKLIESGILDATVDKANERNIQSYWEGLQFREQYGNISYPIKLNLDPNSSVNKNKPDHIRYYLINKICAYMRLLMFRKHFGLSDQAMVVMGKRLMNPELLGYQNSLNLNPYINEKYVTELRLRADENIQVKSSQLYKCAQCGNKKTLIKEKQTRAGDEGGTLFITCIVCGTRWKH